MVEMCPLVAAVRVPCHVFGSFDHIPGMMVPICPHSLGFWNPEPGKQGAATWPAVIL